MNKGYLILSQNTKTEDYMRLAYGLALSIKGTQSTINKVAIATSDIVPAKYKKVFDYIIDIPWDDQSKSSEWKIENKWKYYYMTPFEETVVLDADMIFQSDISYWWDILSSKDMWFTSQPVTFKGEVITTNEYRKSFISNNLPNVYTAFMYFKKNRPVAEVFRLVEFIFKNWKEFYYEFLDDTRPKYLSGDVAYALAIKILGLEYEYVSDQRIPTFVHMKSYAQNIDKKLISDDWTKTLPTYFTNDCKFKIGNYEQQLPVHYQNKHWLTDDILFKLEKRLG